VPRDIPVGNGRLLVCFDSEYRIRDLYFPHVGQENHVNGNYCRIGFWADGSFSWVGQDWKVALRYASDTLVTDVNLYNDQLGLLVTVQGAVDFHKDIYVREIEIENLRPEPREIRIFFTHDFSIYGNDVGDTAAYDPETGGVVHYKAARYFLVKIHVQSTWLCLTPHRGAGACPQRGQAELFPNSLLEIEMQLLFTTLFVFLVFNVLADHFCIQPYRVNTISLGPEVVAPIGLPFKIRKLLEYSYCCPTLHRARQVRYRDLWRRHTDQMNVVCLDIEFHNFAPQAPAKYLDAVVKFPSHHAFQDTIPVLRHPDQVILAMPYRM